MSEPYVNPFDAPTPTDPPPDTPVGPPIDPPGNPDAPGPPSEGVTPQRTEKEKLLFDIQGILTTYNNMESNIPARHEYWAMSNKYRGMP